MSNENLSIDEWLEQMLGVVKDPETGEFEYKAGNPISTANPEPEEPEKIEVTPIQSQMESDDSELARALEEYKKAHAAKEARTQMGQESLENNLFEQVSDSIKTK